MYSKVSLEDGSRDERCLFFSNVLVSVANHEVWVAKLERTWFHGESITVEWFDQPLPMI